MFMFCRSLFILLSFFFWPLCCLSFPDLQILITPLVSSNSSSAKYGFSAGWSTGVESNQSVISGRLPTIINIVLVIILSMRSGLLCEQVSLRVMLSTSSYAVCSRDRTDQIQSRLHPTQCRTIILSLQCDYATSFIRQPIFFNFKRKLTIQLYNRNIWNECNFPK